VDFIIAEAEENGGIYKSQASQEAVTSSQKLYCCSMAVSFNTSQKLNPRNLKVQTKKAVEAWRIEPL
jgi:hypothetical protein